MRIERIEVRRFGCLRELLIEHPGPMTLIFGENGSGKSTLMTFIYSILYGLGPAGRSAETNTRLHYMPWGENEMGGSLDIRHGDHTLRIERGFGGKRVKIGVVSGFSRPESGCFYETRISRGVRF